MENYSTDILTGVLSKNGIGASIIVSSNLLWRTLAALIPPNVNRKARISVKIYNENAKAIEIIFIQRNTSTWNTIAKQEHGCNKRITDEFYCRYNTLAQHYQKKVCHWKCSTENFAKFFGRAFSRNHLRITATGADYYTKNEEILNGKLRFLCSGPRRKLLLTSVWQNTGSIRNRFGKFSGKHL